MQMRLNLDTLLSYAVRHGVPMRAVPSANKRGRDRGGLWGRFPGEKALDIAAKWDWDWWPWTAVRGSWQEQILKTPGLCL